MRFLDYLQVVIRLIRPERNRKGQRVLQDFYEYALARTTDIAEAPPPQTPLECLQRIADVRAIHTLIAGATARLTWNVAKRYNGTGNPDEFRSRNLDRYAGHIVADYLVLGQAFFTENFTYVSPLEAFPDTILSIQRPNGTPLQSAFWLMRQFWELNRAETQILALMGAAAFLYPKDSNMPLTGDELDQLRKNLQDKVRKGGVGGIEPVSVPVELIPIPIDNQKYRLIEIRTQLIRQLCNLFQIDSSLLNDPENKTYSNKTLALKALYTNVIIPTAYEVAYALQTRTLDYVITIETSNIELLHEDRVAQADYVIKLLQAGLITPEKARSLLELD
jgi:hypothetical protein